MVQALTPGLTGARTIAHGVRFAAGAAVLLTVIAGAAATPVVAAAPTWVAATCFLLFGAVFAVVSSPHSGLVVAIAGAEDVAERIGLYNAANSVTGLVGTLTSGWLYGMAATPIGGMQICLVAAASAALLGGPTLLPVRRGC